ncbi:hypothetical protein NPIL_252051 [Nephila pilipes]|uniref:Uncharacterized protein n=1 Tax=Nephila pilipes TaxID=299642 RepID=A0A8X6N7R2_NEPPI|nr:hypothetical protein NPIL_252051 [Nephila pilipes]
MPEETEDIKLPSTLIAYLSSLPLPNPHRQDITKSPSTICCITFSRQSSTIKGTTYPDKHLPGGLFTNKNSVRGASCLVLSASLFLGPLYKLSYEQLFLRTPVKTSHKWSANKPTKR